MDECLRRAAIAGQDSLMLTTVESGGRGMEIAHRHLGDIAVVTLSGRLDASAAPAGLAGVFGNSVAEIGFMVRHNPSATY
jgi:hypothetical protein